jgi:serpin B
MSTRWHAFSTFALLITVACTSNDPSGESGESGGSGESGESGETGETGDEPWPMAESELPRDDDPQPTTDEQQALADDNLALSLDLYHELREGDAAGQGFTLSAYSIQSAFGMLYGGTVEPAATEMATTLHFSLPDERQHVALNWLDLQLRSRNIPETPEQDPVILETANGVWAQAELGPMILPDYLDLLAVHYGTGVALADFFGNAEQERLDINLWVSDRTHELIPEFFKPGTINSEISMVLVNALYLNSPWGKPFPEGGTSPADFTRLDGSVVSVDMMALDDLSGSYGEGTGYRALAMPLRNGALEVVAILPDDFAAFEAALDVATLDTVLSSLEFAIVTTELPRFELELDVSLATPLQTLGLVTPFMQASSFEGIVPGGVGPIADVIHHTVMKVDEKGVEAAAATGILLDEGGGGEPLYTITFDRPFLVLVRDTPTGTLLFFGRVLDPSA